MTVLIVAYRNRGSIAATLNAVRRQTRAADAVVLVESGDDGTAAWVRAGYPEVCVIEAAERLFPGPAHNRGLEAVETEGVALLDADCLPDEDWLTVAERALSGGARAVGGSIRVRQDSSLVDWAYFLSEFTSWLPGRPRALRDMPTCNAAYLTEVLRRAGGFTELPILSADSLLHWTLRERFGMALRFVPEMAVRHRYDGSAKQLLARRFGHGRSLAHARRLFGAVGLGQRMAWIAVAAGFLPILYALRLVWHCLGHADVPARSLLRALPLTLAGLTAWAWGQAAGMAGALPTGVLGGSEER